MADWVDRICAVFHVMYVPIAVPKKPIPHRAATNIPALGSPPDAAKRMFPACPAQNPVPASPQRTISAHARTAMMRFKGSIDIAGAVR